MSTSVKLPQWGMAMNEGTVTRWIRSPGDHVAAGDELVEVEAAKVTNVVVAPVDGVLGEHLVTEDTTVEVNTVLVEILGADEAPADGGPAGGDTGGRSADATAADRGAQDAVTADGTTVDAAPAETAADSGGSAPEAPAATAEEPPHAGSSAPAQSPDRSSAADSSSTDIERDAAKARAASGRVTNVVPLARKLAKENGIDLHTVTGSGTGGRIVAQDIRDLLERGSAVADADSSDAATVTAGAADDAPSSDSGDRQRMSRMRAVIAERMTTSLRESAQLTLTTTADVTAFAQLRAGVGGGARRPGYVDAVIRACALALADHPMLLARLDGDEIVSGDGVHVGMAVAVEDGLLVPVIRDADRLGLAELSTTARELAEKARSGGLDTDDLEGGTFSVTSLGGQGVDAFTPILNPPQSAILGIGRSREVPIRYGDGFAWRQEMTLSLTIDHRVVDGYPGALFLQDVVRLLENPRGLL